MMSDLYTAFQKPGMILVWNVATANSDGMLLNLLTPFGVAIVFNELTDENKEKKTFEPMSSCCCVLLA